jgi:translation initiation factor 1
MGVCACHAVAAVSVSADGVVRVSRETKGRAGKGVTLVKGLGLEGDALTALAKALKATCGSGGTVKDGVVEVQGDHCDKVLAYLAAKGWKAKRAGG